jgi:hypothetical protein
VTVTLHSYGVVDKYPVEATPGGEEAGNGGADISIQKYTDKKENQIFLIYKEIQSGAVAKSCMRQGFLFYEEMR